MCLPANRTGLPVTSTRAVHAWPQTDEISSSCCLCPASPSRVSPWDGHRRHQPREPREAQRRRGGPSHRTSSGPWPRDYRTAALTLRSHYKGTSWPPPRLSAGSGSPLALGPQGLGRNIRITCLLLGLRLGRFIFALLLRAGAAGLLVFFLRFVGLGRLLPIEHLLFAKSWKTV